MHAHAHGTAQHSAAHACKRGAHGTARHGTARHGTARHGTHGHAYSKHRTQRTDTRNATHARKDAQTHGIQ